MKTSVIMTRRMGQFEVLQRTKDEYFDANALLRQWNANESNADLRISKFMSQQKVVEFIEALKEELQDGANQPIGDYQLLITTRGRHDKRGHKTPDQVWMHPYLFVKFAMWLNPRFEVKVVKFVYDQLIQYRHGRRRQLQCVGKIHRNAPGCGLLAGGPRFELDRL